MLMANTEDLNYKINYLTNENLHLKEQQKNSLNIKNKESLNLSDKLKEANESIANYEKENSEMKNYIYNLNLEIENLRKIVLSKDQKLKILKYELKNIKKAEENNNTLLKSYKKNIEKNKFQMEFEKENKFAKSLNKVSNTMLQYETERSQSNLLNKNIDKDNNKDNDNYYNFKEDLNFNFKAKTMYGKNLNLNFKRNNYEKEITDMKNKNNYELRKNYCSNNSNLSNNISDNSNYISNNNNNNINNKNNSSKKKIEKIYNNNNNHKYNNNINNNNPDSIKFLMNNQQIQKLKLWLGIFNNGNTGNIRFNLLLKASKDGYTSKIFKQKCHKKPFTLTVALTSFNKLIGGFTSIPWEEDDFNYVTDFTKRTFLFSLTNNQKYDLKNPGYAICNGTDIGPVFGGGSDFEIVNECNKRFNNFAGFGHTFEANEIKPEEFYGGNKYLIKDYEVYEVNFE